MKFLTIIISMSFMSLSASSFAQNERIDFSGASQTRVRVNDEENGSRVRLQENITLQLKAEIGSGWKLIGIVNNGTRFNSRFDNIYDSHDDSPFSQANNIFTNLELRNLYVTKKVNEQTEVQLGALETKRTLLGINEFERAGWVDGVRIIHTSETFGKVIFTTGSIGDLNSTSLFERELNLDYVEVRIKKRVFQNLLTEIGFERYEDDNYLSLASEYELEIASEKVITLIAESLVDINQNEHKSSVGVRANLSDLFDRVPLNMRVEIRHNYLSNPEVDRLNSLPGGFWNPTQRGHYSTFVLQGDFKSSQKNAFTRFLEDASWNIRVRHEYVTNDNMIEFSFIKRF